MDDRCSGLECGVRGLDLLADSDRYSRVIFLARQRAGDGDRNDTGFRISIFHKKPITEEHSLLNQRPRNPGDRSAECWPTRSHLPGKINTGKGIAIAFIGSELQEDLRSAR